MKIVISNRVNVAIVAVLLARMEPFCEIIEFTPKARNDHYPLWGCLTNDRLVIQAQHYGPQKKGRGGKIKRW